MNNYIQSLIKLNTYDTFNVKINEYCKSYKKAREFGFNAFNKRFCIEAHGLYNLARYAVDGAMIASEVATEGDVIIEAPAKGIYVVTVGKQAVKVII